MTDVKEYAGFIEAPDKRRAWAKGKTFVFTAAQNNTKLHEDFWLSLVRYVQERNAELHVSRFTYIKNALANKNRKAGTKKSSDDDSVWFDDRITPYASDASLQIADDLVWCGELNILPTRVHPLSTLKTYTRGCSGIVPHVKMRMDSVPTMKNAPAQFMYTTGAVTQRNYIQRAAGQVAEFHHVFGALVVELDDSGNWWARQINADDTGGFHDLDTYWSKYGPSEYAIRVQAITHGDLHGAKIDRAVFDAVFSESGILDQLMPKEQFFHDTIDFMPRNHHNRKDPHFQWEMYYRGTDSVEAEFALAADLLKKADRTYCRSFVVVSNHDQAIEGWLRDTTAFYDPPNARYWLELNLYANEAMQNQDTYSLFRYALMQALQKQGGPYPKIILEDESYRILGKIEAGVHGHLGPNGARGNPLNLRTIGKANTGHTHSAGIVDGVYTAGVYGKLDMGYNKGLSSWSHSMIVTYTNGKRAILTIKNGKAWRDTL